MTADLQSAAEPAESAGPPPARSPWPRRLLWIFLIGVSPLSLLLAAVAVPLLWWQAQNRVAAQAVQKEVVRIQAAGEPITTADLYAYHRVPAGVPDLTKEWLAVLASFDERKFNVDAGTLPKVGTGDDSQLDPSDRNNQLAAAALFLTKYDATRQAILAVAKKPGECRIPVKFEEGIGVLLHHAQKMRTVSRLMALDARVKAHGGDLDGAIDSVAAMFATSRATEHQLFLVEQLVSFAIGASALHEAEFLLNRFDLTDEQLARLSAEVRGMPDPQGALTKGMLGERGMGFHLFHHGQMIAAINGPSLPDPPVGEGKLSRPVDCELYLQLMAEMVAASREPSPGNLQAVDKVEDRIRGIAGSRNPWERYQYMYTMMVLPAVKAGFTAAAKQQALRNLVLAALAAERYRLKTGSYPASIQQLVPEFLPAVPADPFDGRPLRMIAGEEGCTFYSVGKNVKDDGGVAFTLNIEPDIVVHVRAKKGDK